MENEHGEEWQIWQLTGLNDRIQIASLDDADYANEITMALNNAPIIYGAHYYVITVENKRGGHND